MDAVQHLCLRGSVKFSLDWGYVHAQSFVCTVHEYVVPIHMEFVFVIYWCEEGVFHFEIWSISFLFIS